MTRAALLTLTVAWIAPCVPWHALATTLNRVAFPGLPVDVVSHVVAFSFHTGYY